MSGFSFGAPAPAGGAPSFSFGSKPSATPAPAAGGFSFGASSTAEKKDDAPAASGFSFGASSTAEKKDDAPAAGKFSFGAPASDAASSNASGGFTFVAAKTEDTKGDAPKPGFSFGAPAPNTVTEKKDDAPKPGFSFGAPAPNTATEKKDDAPKPASGGFSFGATSTAAAAPAASSKDDTTPAPASGKDDAKQAVGGFSFGGTTPAPASGKDDAKQAVGGFSFGGTTPAPASGKDDTKASAPATGGALTTTTATSATTATPAKIEAPPKTYQNQTLEQIINSFSASLEESTVAYLAQARRVAQQDALLRDSQRNISHLSTEVTKLLIQQEELDLRLTQIGDVQDNLDSCMDGLEAQIDTLFERTMTTSGVEDADLERERYFDLAIQTEGRMTHLENVVENMEKNLQELQNNALGGGDLGNILQIMNRQQDMLTSLETSCARIEADMNLVGRKLTG